MCRIDCASAIRKARDFVRILSDPKNALTRQYVALFETEGVALEFTECGLQRLAGLAFRANKTTQDIGAQPAVWQAGMSRETLQPAVAFAPSNGRPSSSPLNERRH